MAVRFSADAQDYTRTVSLGTVSQFSVICWVKISVDRNTNSTVWTIDNGNSDYYAVCTNTDGTTMKFFTESNASGNAQNMTVGTWYCVATSINGVNGSMWTRAITDTSWTSITWSNGTANTTGTTFRIGEHPGGGLWLNGCIAAMKVWNGVTLTLADFEAEAWQYRPKRVSNLVAWFPFYEAGTADYSGNGWTLSGGSGTATEDGPPISIGAPNNLIFLPTTPDTITSTLDITLPPVTGSFTADATITSTLASTLPPVTGSFTATEKITSTLGITLPHLTGAFNSTVKVTAELGAILPPVTGSALAEVRVEASLSGVLPPAVGAFAVDASLSASLASTLPPVTGSFTGNIEAIQVSLSITLPAVLGDFHAVLRVINGIDAVITGIGFFPHGPTGPAFAPPLDGPALLTASSGPATVTISTTGPTFQSRTTTGPATERELDGPSTEREIDGVVI